MQSIGDMAQTLMLRTQQVRLRSEMDQLSTEIATGFVKDPAQHLAGDTSSLTAIDRTLAQLDTYRINTTEARFVAGSMQTALDQMQERTQQVSQVLIGADLVPTDAMMRTLSQDARDALQQVVGNLNSSVAGRFLFSGTATDRPALADVDTLLGDLRTALSGATTLTDVETALDTYFDTTGGGFETNMYQGSDTALAPVELSRTETANIDIRGDDTVFRDLMKSLAMAALATDDTLTLPQSVQTEMLSKAGRDLLTAQKPLVEMRSNLGALEARIEETSTRNAAEKTATSIARLDLIGADQYDTATRYENIRSQLESIYAITVRSSRLSLAEFLR